MGVLDDVRFYDILNRKLQLYYEDYLGGVGILFSFLILNFFQFYFMLLRLQLLSRNVLYCCVLCLVYIIFSREDQDDNYIILLKFFFYNLGLRGKIVILIQEEIINVGVR